MNSEEVIYTITVPNVMAQVSRSHLAGKCFEGIEIVKITLLSVYFPAALNLFGTTPARPDAKKLVPVIGILSLIKMRYAAEDCGLPGPDFDECPVSGVHPSGLGVYRMTEKREPVIHACP